MSYDHSNSESPTGDSMSQSNSGDSSSSSTSSSSSKPSSAATNQTRHNCSYCGTSFLRSETKNMPFCSKRCQQIDLGMWLTEGYGIPYEGDSTEQRFERNETAEDNE